MADVYIIDVWSDNLEIELQRIREASKTHPFLFLSLLGSFSTEAVDLNRTKVIQIGMTLSNKNGDKAKFMDPNTEQVFHCAWQFNFSGFDQDQHAHDLNHITRLQGGGVNLEYNWEYGVHWDEFIVHMGQYKLLKNEKLQWIAFDGAFCFGQLVKFFNENVCPPADTFSMILGDLFPICYDVNKMMRSTNHVPASIEDVAKLLRVRVDGDEASLAASRSVLTCGIFHKLSQLATDELRGVS